MNTQKIVIIIIILIALGVGGWYLFLSDNSPINTGEFGTGSEDAEVVALVNGQEITSEELEALKVQFAAQQGIDVTSLDQETSSQLEAQIIDQLVSQVLLEQAVSAADVEVSEEEVDAQAGLVVTQVGGQEAFEQALSTEGLSEEEFRAQLRSELATQAYLEEELDLSSLAATQEEIEEAYNQAASQSADIPPLEEVQGQVEQSVIQQKQQVLLAEFVQELRANADIEILI